MTSLFWRYFSLITLFLMFIVQRYESKIHMIKTSKIIITKLSLYLIIILTSWFIRYHNLLTYRRRIILQTDRYLFMLTLLKYHIVFRNRQRIISMIHQHEFVSEWLKLIQKCQLVSFSKSSNPITSEKWLEKEITLSTKP